MRKGGRETELEQEHDWVLGSPRMQKAPDSLVSHHCHIDWLPKVTLRVLMRRSGGLNKKKQSCMHFANKLCNKSEIDILTDLVDRPIARITPP